MQVVGAGNLNFWVVFVWQIGFRQFVKTEPVLTWFRIFDGLAQETAFFGSHEARKNVTMKLVPKSYWGDTLTCVHGHLQLRCLLVVQKDA